MTFSGMFRSYLHVILLLLASAFCPSRFPRPTTDCTSSSTVGYGLVRSATALEIDLNVSKPIKQHVLVLTECLIDLKYFKNDEKWGPEPDFIL